MFCDCTKEKKFCRRLFFKPFPCAETRQLCQTSSDMGWISSTVSNNIPAAAMRIVESSSGSRWHHQCFNLVSLDLAPCDVFPPQVQAEATLFRHHGRKWSRTADGAWQWWISAQKNCFTATFSPPVGAVLKMFWSQKTKKSSSLKNL